jgi:uncharacterized protein YndB with AHSA1/START domain
MPSIRHEVLIGAPGETVYHALTSPQGLSAWWTPDVMAAADEGSVSRFDFGPDYFKEMRITHLLPGRLVKWSCVTGAAEWVGTSISFELRPGDRQTLAITRPELADQIRQSTSSDGGTLVIFRHDGWREDSPMLAECSYTWARFLGSLKSLCEVGTGRPWPHQHGAEQQRRAA